MPHLIINRARRFHLFKGKEFIEQHLTWERLNGWVYIWGGIIFTVGSLFFVPDIEERFPKSGAVLFIAGSFLYLAVVLHDLFEVIVYWNDEQENKYWKWIEFLASSTYTAGSLLFTYGSFMFLPDVSHIITGTWCFIIGSFLFLLAASINILQIEKEHSIKVLQLKNVTGITFLVGSLVFVIASVPFLYHFDEEDTNVIFSFSALLFFFGSLCFLSGGIANYRRLTISGSKR